MLYQIFSQEVITGTSYILIQLDKLKPNKECSNNWCLKRQKEYKEVVQEVKEVPVKKVVLHEDNEWGISLVNNKEDDNTPSITTTTNTASVGLKYEYTVEKVIVAAEDQVKVGEEVDLSDLMNQLKSLSKN